MTRRINKQEAHGPHRSPEKTVQINKHIWLYNNINKEKKKKTLLTLWEFTFSSLEETWIPFIQEWFVLRFVEIGSMVLEKKMKMWKVYDNNDDNDDNDDGQRTNFDQKSSLEPSAQVS